MLIKQLILKIVRHEDMTFFEIYYIKRVLAINLDIVRLQNFIRDAVVRCIHYSHENYARVLHV
jgi:hypothetical protein